MCAQRGPKLILLLLTLPSAHSFFCFLEKWYAGLSSTPNVQGTEFRCSLRHRFISVKNATIYYTPRLTKGAVTWCMHVEYANMTKKLKTNVSTGTIFWLWPSMLRLTAMAHELKPVAENKLAWRPTWVQMLHWYVNPCSLCCLGRLNTSCKGSFQYYVSKLWSWRVTWFFHRNQILIDPHCLAPCFTRTNQSGRRLVWYYFSFARSVIIASWIRHYQPRVSRDGMIGIWTLS
jgi:hypothetical protein